MRDELTDQEWAAACINASNAWRLSALSMAV
jgi:hypothetical protein